MPRNLFRRAASAAFLAFPILAQAGNEAVFVASSTSGSTDTFHIVGSGTGSIVASGGTDYTDNVSAAVWANTGRNLYVAQGRPSGLPSRVALAQWNGSTPTWSTFYPAPGPCYGLGLDRFRQLLWVLTGASGSTRELVCLDADPTSVGYGQVLAQTTTLSGASLERWGLSPTGNLAVVPHVFLNSGLLQVVDTTPGSPTFLQVVASTPVPGAAASGFAFTSDATISLDDAYAYVLYVGLGTAALAVFDLGAQAFLDFDGAPGQQDLAITLAVPNRLALSIDRTFAVISGQGGGGGAMRVDFDYVNPPSTVTTTYVGLTVPNCDGVSLSPENTRAAVTSTQTFLSPPSRLVVFDVFTGSVLQDVTLPSMWNAYTTAWQDASPTATYEPFGIGCTGTLGVPQLAAWNNTRPAFGTTFTAAVTNLPLGIGGMMTGLSNTVLPGGIPLPLDLGLIGMPGCSLLVDPVLIDPIGGAVTTGFWSWSLPNATTFFGFNFYNQALSFDPGVNAFGFTVSNGCIGTLGF